MVRSSFLSRYPLRIIIIYLTGVSQLFYIQPVIAIVGVKYKHRNTVAIKSAEVPSSQNELPGVDLIITIPVEDAEHRF